MRRSFLIAAPLGFLAVFFAWPVVAILGRGLIHNGALDLQPLLDTIAQERMRNIAGYTVGQAALSTAITVVIGVPVAIVLEQFSFRGVAAMRALVVVPFVLPTIVVGAAFRSLGLTGSLAAIVLAHAYFNVAVVVRIVGTAWAHRDNRHRDIATMLGANPWQRFSTVTVPYLRPAILGSTAIVFLFCFTSFGVILVLGAPGTNTIETEIYRTTTQLLDLRTAAALTLLQMVVVLTVLGVGRRIGRGPAAEAGADRMARPVPPRGRQWGAVVSVVAVVGIGLGLPMLELVRRSLAHGGAGYEHLGRTLSGDLGSGWDAIRTSVAIALVATIISVMLGLAASIALAHAARHRWARLADGFLMLPLGISAVTVGFGFLITLDEPPLDLRTSWWIIPIAHSIVALPFVIRATLPIMGSIPSQLRGAATMLGAGPHRVWWEIDFPIVRRAAAVAAGFAAVISLGEFGATLFIVRPETTTLPVAIFRGLGRPGAANTDRAMALAVALMVITMVIMLIAGREGNRRPARTA